MKFLVALLTTGACLCFARAQTDISDQIRELENVEKEIVHEQLFDEEISREEYDSGDKRCVPMLNLPSYFNGYTPSPDGITSLTMGPESSYFSFSIGDINLPIAAKNSSIGSAMKFLHTIGSHFDQDDEQSEPEENVVKFRENRLQIQGLNLSMLNIHLYSDSDPRFGVGITIKNTTMTGKFVFNGPLILSETALTGYYRMSIDNVYLVVASNLTKQENSPTGEHIKLRANDFRLNITNLGYISIDILDSSESYLPTTNYLLRVLQKLLQRTIKRTYSIFESHIREALEKEIRQSLDCELTRFTPMLERERDLGSNISNHQNDLARIINSEITRSQFSFVPLPDFEHQQSILGTPASIQFYNGSLSGLNNIKLTGETRIKLQDEHLLVNTSIGWVELKPYYNWNLQVGTGKSSMTKGFVAFNIKGIDFDAVITRVLKPQARFVVDQLVIKQLDNPKMDISGLPGMNRLTRGMVNFFMSRLKQRLTSSIQPVLRQQLERLLNKIYIPA